MRVSVNVEFDVQSDELLDEKTAKKAAESAVYHYMAFTEDGIRINKTGTVFVNVDGHGECEVSFPD